MPFDKDNLPKNKEEWAQFAKDDPVNCNILTQERMDQIFRRSKEVEEENGRLKVQVGNLSTEVTRLKVAPSVQPVNNGTNDDKSWSTANLPESKEDWENLAIDDPVLFHDLRNFQNTQVANNDRNFEESRTKARWKVQAEHPDMYLPDIGADGQPKKDDKGKVVLKIDPNTGEPFFDPSSEKGKLFTQIFNENPQLSKAKDGPTFIMAEMERRLREKAQKVVDDANRSDPGRDSHVVTDGVKPPDKTGKVTFATQEERSHAEGSVKRGTFKNLEEYCQYRDTNQNYAEGNRIPTFGGKPAI